MGRVNGINRAELSGPSMAPLPTVSGSVVDSSSSSEDHWSGFDNSVNAVSFGFVATAILISLFLVMAIFERFLRPRSTPPGGRGGGHSPPRFDHITANGKLDYPSSPKMSVYAKGVSVLMPGEEIPTFIAHHALAPCCSQ